MKRIALIAIAATLLAGAAHAEGTMGGLGFRSAGPGAAAALSTSPFILSTSPTLGVRHWLSERAGIDAAFGFVTLTAESGTPTATSDEATGFAFEVGIPVSAKKWEKVNVIIRPGFAYGTATIKDKTTTVPPNEFTTTVMNFSGELEVEWMVAERLSVSATHGIAYHSLKVEDNDSPASEFKVSAFETTGSNFTALGFHVYIW